MKKFLSLCTFALIATGLFAQAPEKMSYQAVIRDANDLLITNQTVGMQFSILQGNESGTPVYIEQQTTTSNDNGLVSVEIGTGNVILFGSTISDIDWSDGPYFLKREIDPNGGTDYTIYGTSELLSVPYALYADRANSFADGDYVLNYSWPGVLSGNNTVTLASTNATWNGNRRIMLSGYVQLDFNFPGAALSNSITEGTANVDLYLKYNGQIIMSLNFKHIQIEDNANVTLPFNALIPNSVAGNSRQFSVEGVANNSYTNSFVPVLPDPPVGPYAIDVIATVVFSWVEL